MLKGQTWFRARKTLVLGALICICDWIERSPSCVPAGWHGRSFEHACFAFGAVSLSAATVLRAYAQGASLLRRLPNQNPRFLCTIGTQVINDFNVSSVAERGYQLLNKIHHAKLRVTRHERFQQEFNRKKLQMIKTT